MVYYIMKVSQVSRRNKMITSGGVLSLFIFAGIVSIMYRGIFGADLADYFRRADSIYFNCQLYHTTEAISSVLYPASIAVAYPLVGHTLLASHFVNLFLWILLPVLFFFLLRRMLHNQLWAWIGAIVYLCYPTNLVWLNHNSTEVMIVFWFVLTLLLNEYARTHPALFLLIGITCACMVLTRLFDGLLLTGILGAAILYEHRKTIPFKWVVLGFLVFLGVQYLFAIVFGYSLEQYGDYIQQMATNADFRSGQDILAKRVAVLKTLMGVYIRWLFADRWLPLFLFCLLLGIIHQLRKNIIAPTMALVGYSLFLFFSIAHGGFEIFFLRQSVKMIAPLTILLISGAKMIYDWIEYIISRKGKWIAPCIFIIILLGCGSLFYRQNLAFIALMSDIIPASSLINIIRNNPVYPVFPAPGTNVEIRENMIKAVTGAYRPSYLARVAQQAWEEGVPHQEREQADFAYRATFSDETSWKTNILGMTGTSPLWSAERSGHLGAFPYQAEATLVYKFSFPQKAQKIVLSDIHSQWAPGDVVRMWTSSDGQLWTLRYDDNLRYQKIHYHEELTEEIAGIQTLYVKYYFYAGDPNRDAADNRGATLDEFSLAITFQYE